VKEGKEAAECKGRGRRMGCGGFRKSFCWREEEDLMVTEAGIRRVRS